MLLCLALAACANPFGSETDPTSRQALENHAAVTDEPAVVVPTVLPAGYGMLWANMYFPGPGAHDQPGIAVCVVASEEEIVGRCVGTDDASPWRSFEVDGHVVVITTVSSPERPELLDPWLALDWTPQWEDVPWVDATFERQTSQRR